MLWTRRHFIKSASALTLSAATPAFVRPVLAEDGFLEITAGPSRQRLYQEEGALSDLWTYNGFAPGPEIRVTRGERVRVRFVNNLEEPSSIHWHGIRIDNAMDGVSGLTQEAVPPGASFDYDFTVPDAGTYWYHAHNKSWNQVARGLYGPLIVDEEEAAFDREHDLTLVADDWRLSEDETLDTASMGSLMEWAHAGRLGNWLTVNGLPHPKFSLKKGEAYRLRLVNASNARILELDPNRFGGRIIAYDGQALGRAETLTYAPFLLGPAQRVDLIVVPESDFALEELSGDSPFEFATFKVSGNGTASGEPVLPAPNAIPEPDLPNARRVRLDMTGGAMGNLENITYQGRKLAREDFRKTRQVWAFNGVANLGDDPLFAAKPGETILIEVLNNTSWAHAMHVHGHHFKVVKRSGAQADADPPWRDTFLIGSGQTVEIASVADNSGKWLFHCHMLEHAAAGMTSWFEVA
ncbi:multicopper oxidase family protein [Roseibium sp.]|uniref:multicopper oxidase family protein n=1 Tax=Roseibium sp. TaxID=1936156 RepID=UPI003D0DCC92